LDGTYNRPAWRPDYESVQANLGLATASGNYFTVGGRTLVSPKFADRFAAYLRYDLILWGLTSVALKYIHEEWRYLSSSKETWSLDYNFLVPVGQGRSGFYMTFGAYYRFLKQRWDAPWSSPFNYNTRDQEWFFHSVMGWQFALGSSGTYLTFDWNLRDQFSYYNFDNMAFDSSIHFDGGDHFIFKLDFGIRTSALTMGAGYPAEYFGGLGMKVY
jgi:hypothetical protein